MGDRAETQREEESARDDRALRLALDLLPDGAIAVDARGRVIAANASFCSLLGLPRGTLDLGAGPPRDALLPAIEESLRDGSARRLDVEVPTPGGDPRVIECRVTPAPAWAAFDGVTCLLRDVTAERRATEAQRESASRAQQAIWLAALGIWDWDSRTDEVSWNDEMLRIYGVAREEFTGRGSDYFAFTHPEDRARQLENVRSAFERGVTEAGLASAREIPFSPKELRIVRPDGTVRHTLGDAVTIVDNAGKPMRMLGVTLDVTERRALEEQVRHAQKLDSVGQIAAGVAHDFNNLLAVISLYASAIDAALARGARPTDELEHLKQATARGAELTRQLLTFARRAVARPRSLDVGALLSGMQRMLARVLGEHIALEVHPPIAQLAVLVDPGQLEQVLLNCAINARDAMPDGGRVSISVSEVDARDAADARLAPGRYARISIVDDGIGMTKDVASRVFEPFFTTKGAGRGTGLGLSTVQGIVTEAGGAVTVTSSPGAGSRFDIYLPLTSAPIEAAVVAEVPLAATREGTVLLVEDDATLRRAVRAVLERSGLEVFEAPSSSIAARAFSAFADSLDVLLTDVVMPGVSGQELAQVLTSARPELAVIFMSGHADPEPGGRFAFLQKPFSEAELLAAVDAALAQKVRAGVRP